MTKSQQDPQKQTGNNIAILFSDFGPYHISRIDALAEALAKMNDTLIAYRFSENSDTYGWDAVSPKNIRSITLYKQPPNGKWASVKTAMAFYRSLKKEKIKTVFLPSYSPFTNLLCFLMAKRAGCNTILMNESWIKTEKAGFWGRKVKRFLVKRFDAALVGGHPQKEYACKYGQKESNVFLGYDIVNNNHFLSESIKWKNIRSEELPIQNLPKRYFLNLGRFVYKKNIDRLINAYLQLDQTKLNEAIALVLVGEGGEEQKLREIANNSGITVRNGLDGGISAGKQPEIVFFPFQQISITPLFFSRCEAFILPSLYEEWGLVVNEAMACSAAVLVSENVGSAKDLVIEGYNGFQFDPLDVRQLSMLMQKFVDDEQLSKQLGLNGAEQIKNWGPERFAEGALNAMNVIKG